LSSTEAAYFATSEIAKEVVFAKQLLESMGIKLTHQRACFVAWQICVLSFY
jgi:hypothetical protein